LASLDTNCLLRWILGDVPEQTALVNTLISSGENLIAPDAVLIETVFVIDCYLSVLVRRSHAEPLYTFDQKMANQLPGVSLLKSDARSGDPA
jgi:hypothetical protein